MKTGIFWIVCALIAIGMNMASGLDVAQPLLGYKDIIHYNNATWGHNDSNRSNESIKYAVLYPTFDAVDCNCSNIAKCNLFGAYGIFNQTHRYNVTFNYYLDPEGQIYQFVPDEDNSWSSRGLNKEAVAIRTGYLNETWARMLANETGGNASQYNQPTDMEYKSLARLLATMILDWNYGVTKIIPYNMINKDFPDPNIDFVRLERELKVYNGGFLLEKDGSGNYTLSIIS